MMECGTAKHVAETVSNG